MFSHENVSECFFDLIEKGYELIFDKESFFLLGAAQGVLIKIHYSNTNHSINSWVIKCLSSDFSEQETISSLNEFQADFDYVVAIEGKTLNESLSELYKEIIANQSLVVFDTTLEKAFVSYGRNLIDNFKLSSYITKHNSMCEDLYLWNEHLGLKIERNYHDFHIGCAVFQYAEKGGYIVPNKVIPLESLLQNNIKSFATSTDLSDLGQETYFTELSKVLISEKDVLNNSIRDKDVDWISISGPRYEQEKIRSC